RDIVEKQRQVLAKFGYDIAQDLADRVPHGRWLTEKLEKAADDEVILFLDIDAFPTNRDIIERAFAAAEAGGVFGVAQTANHVPRKDFVYAAPSFLAVSKKTWVQLGKPNLIDNSEVDAGMEISVRALEQGIPVDILYPNFIAVPMWPLANKGAVGIATFYDEGSVFHLYQARVDRGYREALINVAQCVLDEKPFDYIGLFQRLNSFEMKWIRQRERFGKKWDRFVTKTILRQPWPKPRPSDYYAPVVTEAPR
ncbi:MAG: hypothetical protein ABW199_02715, partial [Caulobacterales bacterium]